MKLEKPNLFPEALVAWLAEQDKSTIRRSMAVCVAKACSATSPPILVKSVTKAEVETLDNRYFELQDQGDAEGSMQAFRQARLAAAAVGLREDDLESSVYEYLHSMERLDAAVLIDKLMSA